IVFYSFLYYLSGPLGEINPLLGLAELWALLFALVLAIAKYKMPSLKNTVAVISSAGVGALFGISLDVLPAVLFIVGLSVYDVIAVFYTKHMLTMAREMGKRQMSFSVSVESVEKRKATPEEKERMTKEAEAKRKAEIKELKASGKKVPAAYAKVGPPKEYVEEKRHLELGTGDMAIPLMLAVSVLRFGGIGLALATVVGACAGLYFTLDYVFSRKTFLPALPPISGGALLALAIGWIAGL
ncbi:MAG: presenilin family intramembrane aspartyl protease, partial [Candidatus Micrarchaeota archaeon]